MNKWGGKYCCLPDCSNSSYSPNISLHLVPNGKHKRNWFGSSADVVKWSQEFCQVLYKYREKSGNNFGKEWKMEKCIFVELIFVKVISKKMFLEVGVSLENSLLKIPVCQKKLLRRRKHQNKGN